MHEKLSAFHFLDSEFRAGFEKPITIYNTLWKTKQIQWHIISMVLLTHHRSLNKTAICYVNFTPSYLREGSISTKISLSIFKNSLLSLPNNSHIFLINTIQSTNYKHMLLITLKIRILFINKKISLLNFLFKFYLNFI